MRPDLHTRTVALAKVILPLAALAILSSLFLLSGGIDPHRAAREGGDALREAAMSERVGLPEIAGTTRTGERIRVTADSASRDRNRRDLLRIERVAAHVEAPGGARIDARAWKGEVEMDAQRLRLENEVTLETSTGYRIETDALEGSLRELRLVAPGPVRAMGPPGQISAGGMVVENRGGLVDVVFQKGVRLVYRPTD
ncbi:MAG: hypothetical protein D6688_11925 [Alphaproteobacteria bacterium]|nr:MAG: hypothetical protein D6688_11925 [Alphaproteobacteria bacterium]